MDRNLKFMCRMAELYNKLTKKKEEKGSSDKQILEFIYKEIEDAWFEYNPSWRK